MTEFIGRQSEIQLALDALSTENDGVVLDIAGVHGIGKSMLLDRAAEIAKQRWDDVKVLRLDMCHYDLGVGFHDDFGPNASTAVLWETFLRSRDLMGLLADQPSRDFDQFRNVLNLQNREADLLASNALSLGRHSKIDNLNVETFVNMSDEMVRQRIRETQTKVDDAFVAAWREFTRRRRVLITVDTFQLVMDDEMGHWMARIALRLPNTVVLLARTPSDFLGSVPSAGFRAITLDNFTVAETAEFLTRRLAPEPLPPEVAKVVQAFTQGHPGGVALTADLIVERGVGTLDAKTLHRVLERLPEERDDRWAVLVRLILEAVQEPRLARAVEAAATAPTFDATLLGKLIEAQPDEVGDILEKLRKLRLVRQVASPGGLTSSRFELHEFIRLSVANRLRTYYYDRWQNLHRVAAQHFFDRLAAWDEGSYQSYGAWYRFEESDWQENKRDWLWHSGRLERQRAITRTRFVLLFFEAFWWWACYVPFPFNRRLIEDWSRTAEFWALRQTSATAPIRLGKSPDQQLTDALMFLLDNYPTTHLKPPTAPWDEIRYQLLLVRRVCGLRQGRPAGLSPKEEQEFRRADAFTDLFLAHTRRFRDPHDPKAEQYYGDAVRAFVALDDVWTTAWLHFECADLALEQDDLDKSLGLIRECAGQIRALLAADPGDWDHELVANAHRTRADVHWAAGEPKPAGVEYGRAVTHAYRFQGDPHSPDEYTQQFYLEITTRAAERVAALAGRAEDRELFVAALRDAAPHLPESAADLDGRDVAEIRALLFPRGPAAEELRTGQDDSPFMREWADVHESVWSDDWLAGLTYLADGG